MEQPPPTATSASQPLVKPPHPMPDPISIWSWNTPKARQHDALEALYLIHDNYTRNGQEQVGWAVCAGFPVTPGVQDNMEEDLDEFDGTDFQAALLSTSKPTKKRRKFDILSCIPEPKYIPWPDLPGRPRTRLSEIKPHRIRHEFVPNIAHELAHGHKRYAWIIPVSGKPRSHVPLTEGAMLVPGSEDERLIEASMMNGTKEKVTWTPADLLLFWLWLKDTRKESITGSISLSFTSTLSGKAPHPSDSPPPTSPKAKIYYIALYHDAAQSLVLRSYVGNFNTVKMWKVLKDDSRDVMASKGFAEPTVERSVLKNTRLLLADESGKGVLIS